MATLKDVNKALVALVRQALTDGAFTNVVVGSDWPSTEARQKAGNANGQALVAVIHKFSSYQSKNFPFEQSETHIEPGIASTLSDTNLAPGQSITLTIGYSAGSTAVITGDMIGCSFTADTILSGTFTAPAGATLSSVATGLAASINSAAAGITASVVGAVITLNNTGLIGYKVSSNVGSKFTVQEAIQWAIRNMYVSTWSGSLQAKHQIHAIIEDLLNRLTWARGFTLPSGEWIELKLTGAKPNDQETDKDVYSDYFLFNVEHWVDARVDKWSVIALSPTTTIQSVIP
jgi:hypothetical protein